MIDRFFLNFEIQLIICDDSIYIVKMSYSVYRGVIIDLYNTF